MNERDGKNRKLPLGMVRPIKEKNSYITASKLSGICVPKNPPNISIYYHHLKVKENLQTFHNKSEINMHQDQDYTKTKHNKFKNLANQIINHIPIYRPIEYQNQQALKCKKSKDTIAKPKQKFKANRQKVQYYTVQDKHLSKWDSNLLSCDQTLSREWMSTHRLKSNVSNTKHYEKPTKTKTFQEQIEEFEADSIKIQGDFEAQVLLEAIKSEQKYSETPHYNCYLHGRQTQLSWIKRAVLIDWMMEVLSEFGNKRETFAKSVSILDRYLATTFNIPLQQLQLVGATCLLIANKLEDNVFCLNDIHQATGSSYGVGEILKYQSLVLSTLKWKLNPPTANMWANRLCAQWDLYLDSNPHLVKQDLLIDQNISNIKFKTSDEKAYYNFRWLNQYLDFSLLDVHTLQYQARTLAASFIFLIVALRLRIYSMEEVTTRFPSTSHYLLQESTFNTFFDNFLQFSFSIHLIDLLPTVQYCSTFVILPLNFDLPPSAKDEESELNFEEFCSFQTRNKSNMLYLQKRNRNYD